MMYAKRVTGALLFLAVIIASPTMAESFGVDSANWCGTQILWEKELAAQGVTGDAYRYACPQYGPCDEPEIRDSWIPDPEAPMTYIRLAIHYLANSDGSDPITTPAEVQYAVDLLNQYYLTSRIQFDYVADQVNVTDWRILSASEIDAMKSVTAVDPEHFLNIWVTQVDFGYSFGTFPFSDDALEATGGIVLGHFHWAQSTYTTFAHEIGHCLGLWHTFNGVDEVTWCGSCYERVDAADRDILGDRCSDTPPTPTWRQCSDAPGTDTCSNMPWGDTQPENYMGYVPHWCRSLFTPHQIGRMHCWTDHLLAGWKSPVLIEADADFGRAPLQTTLSGVSFRQVDTWLWDLGDQSSSTQVTPTHTYAEPGLYTIGVEIQTSDNTYGAVAHDLIWVEADTLSADSVAADPGEPIGLDITLTNYVPVREMILPLSWSAENGLELDSISTVGLRTAGFETQALLDNDSYNRRAALHLVAAAAADLTAGAGPIVKLFFTSSGGLTDTTRIDFTSYGPYAPIFTCDRGFYEPDLVEGAIFSSSCCRGRVGDANYSGEDEPTVSDVSTIIDMLFITGAEVDCLPEADINQSGGADPIQADITVSDVSTLVDYLFITGPSAGLPDCL